MRESLFWIKNAIMVIIILFVIVSFRDPLLIIASIAFLVFLIVLDYYQEGKSRKSVF
ncbi:MAG: hypothetical protein JSV76_07385 [Candidatus Bathyarchaeota archaeon]|nr:MAG: hypothetical protein JSV76_07385 [Candidatus Bathyarchaeota archaeon]